MPVVVLAILLSQADAQSSTRYDGGWWQAISKDEQDGFVSGYLDCYIWDAKGTDYSVKPIELLVADVTKYYSDHPGAQHTIVPEALRLLSKPQGLPVKGARHGVYDGDYWRQSESRHRAAFVRGYITCQSVRPEARYSQPVESYVNAISKWYGVSEKDESQLDEKTANDKIGDVLSQLRDSMGSKSHPPKRK